MIAPPLSGTRASIVLDAIRAVAAQAVVIGHAISFFRVWPWAQPPQAPYMQNIAVQVFFVLSGFLIAYTLARKRSFTEYFVERFARIYSAYIPALVFIVAVDVALISLDRYDVPRHHLTLHAFLGNLIMVQNLVVPTLGSGGPLWTLAIEWHLYMVAGALFFLRRAPWLVAVVLAASFVPLKYLISGSVDPGRGLTLLWLFGFAGYFALPYLRRCAPRWLTLVMSCSVGAYLWFLPPANEYQPFLYVPLAIGFLAFVALAFSIEPRSRTWDGAVRYMADYSFTLYLVHHTIVYATHQIWGGPSLAGAIVSVLLSNGIAVVIAIPSEMRHRPLARMLKARYRVT
jgi:peptidoglycan/LPS O-acetylase OafA/YrhL